MKKSLLYLLIGFFLSACSSVAITGRKQLSLVSQQDVLTSSFQQYGEFMKSAKISDNKAATEMVVKVGTRIKDAVERYFKENNMSQMLEGYRWEFHLVKSTEVNAFCMREGRSLYMKGFYPTPRMKQDWQ